MADPLSGPGLPDNLTPDNGHMEPTTWGEIGLGHIVRDKKDRLHIVVGNRQGMITLHAVLDDAEATMPRPPDSTEVWIYVPSETECRVLLDQELGARLLRRAEDREHTIHRAATFRVPLVKRGVVELRDHIDWFHGVSVDDVLRRHNGTKANPSNKARKAEALEELVRAHDEMHADPDMWPHKMAHHHG